MKFIFPKIVKHNNDVFTQKEVADNDVLICVSGSILMCIIPCQVANFSYFCHNAILREKTTLCIIAITSQHLYIYSLLRPALFPNVTYLNKNIEYVSLIYAMKIASIETIARFYFVPPEKCLSFLWRKIQSPFNQRHHVF